MNTEQQKAVSDKIKELIATCRENDCPALESVANAMAATVTFESHQKILCNEVAIVVKGKLLPLLFNS